MSKSDGNTEDAKEPPSCCICWEQHLLSEEPPYALVCGHVFHAACIGEWFCREASCPLCRTPQPDVAAAGLYPAKWKN